MRFLNKELLVQSRILLALILFQLVSVGNELLVGSWGQVVEVSTSKTGKHGHAKCHFVAIDIFTNKKLEDIVPSSHNCDVSLFQTLSSTFLNVLIDKKPGNTCGRLGFWFSLFARCCWDPTEFMLRFCWDAGFSSSPAVSTRKYAGSVHLSSVPYTWCWHYPSVLCPVAGPWGGPYGFPAHRHLWGWIRKCWPHHRIMSYTQRVLSYITRIRSCFVGPKPPLPLLLVAYFFFLFMCPYQLYLHIDQYLYLLTLQHWCGLFFSHLKKL